MFGPVFFFITGSGVTLLIFGLGWLIWQRKRGDSRVEVRDAPLPSTEGTADPFAQYWSQTLLDLLDWRSFEDVVAAYIRQLGFEVRVSPVNEDGVLEMQGFEAGNPRPVMLVRCKVWDRARVDDRAVRALQEAMTAAGVGQGAFFTTGKFAPAALDFVRPLNIDLVNGSELLERIGQLPLGVQNALLDLATDGQYAVPTCPSCAMKMTRRVTMSAGRPGVYFWGCRNYPRCQRTFPMA